MSEQYCIRICNDCLDDEANTLWISYYEQYYNALKCLSNKVDKNDLFLPTILILSQYMELWIKTILLNYGAGENEYIVSNLVTGHGIDELLQEMIDTISYDEWIKNKRKICKIAGLYAWFDEMSNNKTALSIAMRYPITANKEKSTLNPCVLKYISGECEKFNIKMLRRNIKSILRHTKDVYDNIYSSRVI